MTASSVPSRAVVIGGAGAVGRMFAEVLASSGAAVWVLDRVAVDADLPGVTAVEYDAEQPDASVDPLLADADVVMLALPEPVALSIAERVVHGMTAGGLLAQTLSVQSRFAERLRGSQPVEVLGLNPLFAPALGLAGRGVAAVPVHHGPRTEGLLGLLAGAGAEVVRLDPVEHDRAMAGAQVLTHAAVLSFGLALRELGTDVAALGALAPPPHRTLLALLARIAGGTPEVYWDIQASNPFASDARAALRAGVDAFAAAMDAGNVDGLAAVVEAVTQTLGDDLDDHRRRCSDLFAGLLAAQVPRR